jgi:hypothetical protein
MMAISRLIIDRVGAPMLYSSSTDVIFMYERAQKKPLSWVYNCVPFLTFPHG